jgi:uncharacterized protein YkwD
MTGRLGAVALGLMVLVACGRGGHDDDDDGVSTGDTGALGATEGARDPWPPAWQDLEEEVLLLVNEARGQDQICGGRSMPAVGRLQMDPLLRDVARAHSKDMAQRGFFDHVNPDGDDPFDRLAAAGWDSPVAGENIAWGYPDAEQVVDGWMKSPGHCTNIMERSFRWIGVGYYEGDYWTQVFGG